MTRDPRVDLVFSHNLARYVATGVDPNDAQRLVARIERWEDWCRPWSEEAARHEALAEEAADKGRALTAAEAPGNVSEPEHGAHGAASPIRRRQNTHPRPRSPRGRKWTRQTTMMPRRPA